jgi:iron complex outermembrane receptor protein
MSSGVRSLVVVVVLVSAAPAAAQQAPEWMRGLDELMSLQVTSLSKREQRVADTSAAVFVLTHDDIRRSGMRTVPDLLRLVPGVSVAQIDGNKWAVSARGMSGRQSNKLLVMVDGRSIYAPHFAGVLWDEVDVPVQAIDRIEVIRGPGASVWGANAVNGVINIITRRTAVRRDTSVVAGLGSVDFGSLLHESRIGDRLDYRVFGEVNGIQQIDPALRDSHAAIQRVGGSFRTTLDGRDTVEGSAQTTRTRSHALETSVTSVLPFVAVATPMLTETETWSATGRWTRQLENRGHLQVEGFVDGWWRNDHIEYRRNTADLAIQHRLGVRGRHDVIWGAGYRAMHDETYGTPFYALTPPTYDHYLGSAFVQDEVAVAGAHGRLVLGTKIEHRNDLGWNAQPTARFQWRFSQRHAAWTAVSRALRAPDRVERGIEIVRAGTALPNGLTAVTVLHGNPEIEAETLTSYEAGYRTAFGASTTLDVATFYNRYANLQSAVRGPVSMTADSLGRPYLLAPTTFENLWRAHAAGGEAILVHAPQSFWKLTAAYSLFSIDPVFDAEPAAAFDQGATPRHQGQFRMSASLPYAIDVDGMLFGVGSLDALGVPAYARLDARIAWRPKRPIELSVVAQNLLDDRHVEFDGIVAGVPRTVEIRRTAYAGIAWHF